MKNECLTIYPHLKMRACARLTKYPRVKNARLKVFRRAVARALTVKMHLLRAPQARLEKSRMTGLMQHTHNKCHALRMHKTKGSKSKNWNGLEFSISVLRALYHCLDKDRYSPWLRNPYIYHGEYYDK